MPEKFNSEESLSPEELAKHLRQPEGETGKRIGQMMNKGNNYICLNTYDILSPDNGDHILEIGMGNGYFVKYLLNMADKLSYVGVDFSSTMVQEAAILNQEFVKKGVVQFEEASIEQLPFTDNSFDCITTTNTLYFWPSPSQNARELLRVLKPKGKLVIGYRSKSCLEQLEFTVHNFEKYEVHDTEDLLSNAGFKDISTQTIAEPELDFDGMVLKMDGFYTTGKI